jgi:hypothetical protein
MKNTIKILIISTIAAIAPGLAFADASSSIVLPENFTASIWSQAQDIFNGFQGYVTMIIGVILALIVIGELVGMLRKPNQ